MRADDENEGLQTICLKAPGGGQRGPDVVLQEGASADMGPELYPHKSCAEIPPGAEVKGC